VNQGLDLDLGLKNLVIIGACLSSREDSAIVKRLTVWLVVTRWLRST